MVNPFESDVRIYYFFPHESQMPCYFLLCNQLTAAMNTYWLLSVIHVMNMNEMQMFCHVMSAEIHVPVCHEYE